MRRNLTAMTDQARRLPVLCPAQQRRCSSRRGARLPVSRHPGTGVADYDFKGKYHVRAYWIAQSIRLHLGMCHLVAPLLGWDQEWL